MQQQIGGADFLERGLEGFDQHVGQAMDKADRVGQHHRHLAGQPQAPDGRVERRERTVGGFDAGLRKRVHQGRFPRVGIADQRHGRIGNLEPAPALDRARALDFAEALAQTGEPLAHAAAVDFELGFAGAADADTAARGAAAAGLARKMGPLARQARLQIAQLRDLDLELALQRARALGEDVEDELAAIDHAQLEFLFQVARLRGAERVVEDRQRGAALAREVAHLLDLAAPDKGARVGMLEFLADGGGDPRAGAFGQRVEFAERVFAGDRAV